MWMAVIAYRSRLRYSGDDYGHEPIAWSLCTLEPVKIVLTLEIFVSDLLRIDVIPLDCMVMFLLTTRVSCLIAPD